VTVGQWHVNEPLPAAAFELSFPTGAGYIDQTNHKWYHVQPDGSLREDDDANGVGPPDDEVSAARWYRNKWLLIGLAAALMVGFGLGSLRRRWRR
jgi:hypothetical protein